MKCIEDSTLARASSWRERWQRALAARERLAWAVRVRWLVISGFLTLALVAHYLGVLHSVRACFIGAFVGALLNGLNDWSIRRGRYVGPITILAVAADQLIITFVVAQSGGVESPFVMMYVVQVVTSAMLVDELAAAATALLAAALWLVLVGLQSAGLVSIADLSDVRQSSPIVYQSIWTVFLLYCLALLTYVGGHLARRLSRSEIDLEDRNRQLERALASLEDAFQRLRQAEGQLAHTEKMRGLGQLVAGVAHELNNPISFVSANVEHLERSVDRLLRMLSCYQAGGERETLAETRTDLGIDAIVADLPALLGDCQEGARRTKRIVDDLRLFSRGDGAERWQICDVERGIDSTLALLRHRLGPAIRIHRQFAAADPVECLPGQLNQVFLNLITNAADALGEQGGNIWIETGFVACESVAHLRVAISDDGCGMSAEVQKRALEPFFTTKPMGQGTGLGLSICHGILERHGGSLVLQPRAEGGSCCIALLPSRQPASPT